MVGMSLNDVLACATMKAAACMPALNALGTLKKGAPADLTLLQLQTGKYEFEDNLKEKKTGTQNLVATATIVAGKQV
jgi:dihydroorotase